MGELTRDGTLAEGVDSLGKGSVPVDPFSRSRRHDFEAPQFGQVGPYRNVVAEGVGFLTVVVFATMLSLFYRERFPAGAQAASAP